MKMNEKCIELNQEECEIIARNTLKLQKGDESIKVLDYKLAKAMDGLVGFMGEYFRLQLSIEDQHSTGGVRKFCYFIKSVPINNELHRAECERKRFFHKEICAYTRILPNIQRFASTKLYAECYYARKDLLVLEDLVASHFGYRHLRKNEPTTSKHLKLFLSHLAQLHAASIAWETEEGVDKGEEFKDDLFEMMLTGENEWYIASVKGIIYLAKNYLKPQTPSMQSLINGKLYTFLLNMKKFTEPSTHTRNAFLHRDSWQKNIFYKFNGHEHDIDDEPSSCCIVDFQLSRYAPPPLDVLYFLYDQLTPEQRSEQMQAYLDYYYAELQARFRALNLSINTVTRAEFLAECRRARLPVLILVATCKPLTQMPEGLSVKWRAEEQEKFDYYMNNDRAEFFERIMTMDPTYEAKIMWPIKELVELLLSNSNLLD